MALSRDACRHYQLFGEDFSLARELGHNAHRLSIEWARIQPEPGEFNQLEIGHYIKVIERLKELGIEPVVTLHHFTNPLWFSRLGGWENPKAPGYFLDYAQKIVAALSKNVRYWVTINEPMVYAYYSYLRGDWPPQKRSPVATAEVAGNLTRAHIRCYRLIHRVYKDSGLAAPMVSIAQHMIAFTACSKTWRNNLAVYLRNRLFNFRLITKLAESGSLDYIGLNYYTRNLVDTRNWSAGELLSNTCGKGHDILDKNYLGWEIYPQGLYDLLAGLKKYGLPVFILENGICTSDDRQRWDYIRGHLLKMREAMDAGTKVIGYLYWSLLDNFEWDKGFGPRFGLCEVDYSDFKRTPRESAKKLAQVALTGKMENER